MSISHKVDKKSPEYLQKYMQALDEFYNHNRKLLEDEQKQLEFQRTYIDPYIGKPLNKQVAEAL
jgi:ribosomal protein S17E